MIQQFTPTDSPTLGQYQGATGPGMPAQLVEERVKRVVDEMIDLCTLAIDPEQRQLVQAQYEGIASILLRSQLMLSIFEGRDVEIIKRVIASMESYYHSPDVVRFRF